MESLFGWVIGGLVLAVGAGVFTVVWWRVGDQWADAEYKRFGHGGGCPESGEGPRVIRGIWDDEDGGDEG